MYTHEIILISLTAYCRIIDNSKHSFSNMARNRAEPGFRHSNNKLVTIHFWCLAQFKVNTKKQRSNTSTICTQENLIKL